MCPSPRGLSPLYTHGLTIVGKMAPLNGDVHRAAVAFLVATFALRVVCTIQYDRQQLLDVRGGCNNIQ